MQKYTKEPLQNTFACGDALWQQRTLSFLVQVWLVTCGLFSKEVNPSLTKPPLYFDGALDTFGLTLVR